jgi:hypothetical protein
MLYNQKQNKRHPAEAGQVMSYIHPRLVVKTTYVGVEVVRRKQSPHMAICLFEEAMIFADKTFLSKKGKLSP